MIGEPSPYVNVSGGKPDAGRKEDFLRDSGVLFMVCRELIFACEKSARASHIVALAI
jgi:hypothetical protein